MSVHRIGRGALGKRRLGRRAALIALCISGAIILVNGALLAVYRDRTYPRTTMGMLAVGNTNYAKVQAEEQTKVVPQAVDVVSGPKKVTITLAEMGAHFDAARTKASLAATHSWFPIVAVFTKRTIAVPVAFGEAPSAATATRLNPIFHTDPVAAKIALTQDHFVVIDARSGYDLDGDKLNSTVLKALDM